MDIFTQRKLLIRIVILLTVLNLLLIGLFLWKDYHHKPPRQNNRNDIRETRETRDISEIMKRELKLSNEQVDRIRVLRSSFSETEKILSDAIKDERDSMNIIMFNKNTDEGQVMSLARRIAENDYKMELMRFEQAKELKTICTPAQLEKFEELILEIRDYFRPEDKDRQERR
jgi:hypothetical protein